MPCLRSVGFLERASKIRLRYEGGAGRRICTLVSRFPENAELMFLKPATADVPPSDKHCIICHKPYGTPNDDGSDPEYAVRFPCGHTAGIVCLPNWLIRLSPRPRCMYCNKPMIAARYVWLRLARAIYICWRSSKQESLGSVRIRR